MFSLVLLTAFAQLEPAPAAPSGNQPVQVLARIDKGNLTITSIQSVNSGCYGSASAIMPPGGGSAPPIIPARDGSAPPRAKDTDKVPVKVTVTTVVMTKMELPAKSVQAYSTDGKPISAETLADLLAREKTVLLALDGKKVDPFHLQVYKDGTIVLVPPPNTLHLGGPVGWGGHRPSYRTEDVPIPYDELIRKPRPRDVERKDDR
jgi:hypothetical protein